MLALLSLGGNLGDRQRLMDAAVEALAALPGTAVVAPSPAYRSDPDGPIADQPWFVNLAVALSTALDAPSLVRACRDIEAALGRERASEVAWGPRPIDIDVLATGTAWSAMAPLKGQMDDRPFVVVPLADIVPDAVVAGRSIADYAASADTAGLTRLDWPVSPVGSR